MTRELGDFDYSITEWDQPEYAIKLELEYQVYIGWRIWESDSGSAMVFSYDTSLIMEGATNCFLLAPCTLILGVMASLTF